MGLLKAISKLLPDQKLKPRPHYDIDCLTCAEFARERNVHTELKIKWHGEGKYVPRMRSDPGSGSGSGFLEFLKEFVESRNNLGKDAKKGSTNTPLGHVEIALTLDGSWVASRG